MRTRSKSVVRWIVVLGLMTLATTAFAQSTSVLKGSITDPSGAAVRDATVVARNQATGLERTTQSDGRGAYTFSALPPGRYRLEVRASGFGTQAVDDVELAVATTLSQNVGLKMGGLSEEVMVASDAPVVESATTSVGTVMSERTVQDLPLNGRHFVDLGVLAPGSVTAPQNGFLSAPIRGQGANAFNTAGNREDTVNFMINGVNLNDQVQNQITFQPSINTVQEFRVDNSTFSAEYGRSSGAVVNIATRSGTSRFHGEVFEFGRHDSLDARNTFDLQKPKFERHQFGAALGGPILKERTFFFVSYEGLRQRQGLTLNSVVLTDAQRASVTDPVVARLVDYIPAPTSVDANGVARFQGSGTAPVDLDQFTVDLSHKLGPSDDLKAYYARQSDLRQEPTLQLNTIPGFGDVRRGRRQIGTLGETHVFGPTLVNAARFGFNRIHITFTPNLEANPADFGIASGVTTPIGLPQITIAGGALNFGGPQNFPQGRTDTTLVLSDTLSWQRGRHALKIGGEFRSFTNENFTNDVGQFTFLTVADFLGGRASGFQITQGDRRSRITQRALGLFVQDNLRLRSNLTLELGLRYDVFVHPTESENRLVAFDRETSSLVQVGSGLGEVYSTAANLQPRAGVVWDPIGDGKTSVRAAYAILADQPVTNMITPLAANPPLAVPLVINGPAGTVSFANASTVARAGGLAPQSVDPAFENGRVHSWNLNVQRELRSGLGLMVGYFGSRGENLRVSRNVNQPVAGVRPFPRLAATSTILPGTTLGNIVEVTSLGSSNYNALWVSATKRMRAGLQFNASYTFSKSTDTNSLNSQVVILQESANVDANHALSDYDARHRFAATVLYELPFKGNAFVEGWQVSTVGQFQSGNPLTPVIASGTFTGTANTLRPDLTGAITVTGDPNAWFDTTAFTIPDPPRFGTLGRNTVTGPRFDNVDLSLLKNTSLGRGLRLQMRVEAFNVLNHPNYGQPGRIVGTPNFGRITNTRYATGDSGSSRQVQIAAKLMF